MGMRSNRGWSLDDGYMAVNGQVFDCGIQTATSLARLRAGVSALKSGASALKDNGNGSLMRVLPLALWHQGTDDELVLDAHTQSRPTHAHPRSMVACAFYCLVARAYLEERADPWTVADERLQAVYLTYPIGHQRTQLLTELDS